MNAANDLTDFASSLPAVFPSGCHFIGNEPVRADATLAVLDPSTGEAFAELARGDVQHIDAAVAAARSAFEGAWGALAPMERGRLLHRLSEAILANQERLAQITARDGGKLLAQARADTIATARYFEFYAGACDKLHGELLPYRAGYIVMAERVPFGVTGHIVPWNYPTQIFARSVAASLAAGNACVVKPAEDASLAILEIAHLAIEAGFPRGAFNIVTGFGNEAGAALAAHPGIDHISFTGSPGTGSQVAQAAAGHHCPVTLELGGKSPQLVFADADLDAALPVLVSAIVQNAGQTCSAGSRVLIEQPAYREVMARLAKRFDALTVGSAFAQVDCGPLINAKQRDRVKGFLAQAAEDGIHVAAQGTLAADAPRGGFYQVPTLLGDVPADHAIAQEEVFGPVLVAMPFCDEAHAIELANGTDYGLVAGIWTKDGARQMRVARALRCGQVFVNDYGAGGGVELPFGGLKKSGYGREKGLAGLLSFTTLKTIAVKYE